MRTLAPLSVGFWFSPGHSSVVFGLCALLAAGAHYVDGVLGEDASSSPPSSPRATDQEPIALVVPVLPGVRAWTSLSQAGMPSGGSGLLQRYPCA